MAIEPDIALGVQGAGALGGQNPLDMMSKMQSLQGQMNQNALFRQEMNARQRFGAIMANSPDPATAVQLGMKDPQVAAFAPDLLSNFASLNQTLQATKGIEQTQSSSALDNFIKLLPSSSTDPTKLDSLESASIAAMPDGPAKDSAIKGIQSIRDGVMVGYDPTKPGTLLKYQQNLAGLLIANGAKAEMVPNSDGSQSRIIQVGTAQVDVDQAGVGIAQAHPVNPPEDGTPGNPSIPEATTPGAMPAGPTEGPQHGTSPTIGEAARMTAEGTAAGQNVAQIADSALNIPKTYNQLGALEKLMQATQIGAGSTAGNDIYQMTKAAQRFFPALVPDSVVGLAQKAAGGDAGALQAFQKEAGNLAVSFLKQNQGSWKATADELNTTMTNTGNIESDPDAIMHLLSLARSGVDIQLDQANAAHEFETKRDQDPAFAKQWQPQFFSTWYANKYKAQQGQGSEEPNPATIQGSSANQAATAAAASDPLAKARAAIAAGKDRNAVIQRLREHGIDPGGL